MQQPCKSKTLNPPSAVSAFFNSFVEKGISADFADRRGKRSKVVVIDFQASGPKAFKQNRIATFDYDQQLNDARILAIELLSTAQLLYTPTQPVKDSPQSELVDGVLVIKDNCDQEIMRTPLTNLCKALNGNKTTFVDFKNINWGSCGVIFSENASITSANALAFRISFE